MYDASLLDFLAHARIHVFVDLWIMMVPDGHQEVKQESVKHKPRNMKHKSWNMK